MPNATRKRPVRRAAPRKQKPPPELAADAPPSIIALRTIEHIPPVTAINMVKHAYDDESVLLALLSVLGIYLFPAEDYDGLEWPGLIVRADRRIGDRLVTRLHFVIFADEDGVLKDVAMIARVPDEAKRISSTA